MNSETSNSVKFYNGEQIPLELHKVRVVQKLHLVPVERRLEAAREAGFNTFQLSTNDVYLDMLTDSGVNAMSDNQIAAMFRADDAYAGSQSFDRLKKAVEDVFGKKYLLPAHQGRACENIISRTFVKPGDVVPMNYHFTTTHAHIDLNGGKIEELVADDAVNPVSSNPFKGNLDPDKLRDCIARHGADKIPFVRMEASTNLIGGQPFSIANMREIRKICDEHGIMMVLDASLIGENAYFIKMREEEFKDSSCAEILKTMCSLAELVYFSARKVSSSRGGGICTNDPAIAKKMEHLVPLFEGFLTYGGISVREIEAMAVGLYETTDLTVISQSPSFIEYFIGQMVDMGIPCVTPAGGLGAHIDAGQLPFPYSAGGLSRGSPGGGLLHRLRRTRHGARHPFQRPGRERQRRSGGRGTSPPGLPAPRLHAVPGQVHGGPDEMALRQPGVDRRPGIRGRTPRPALLHGQAPRQERLA